MNRNLKAFKKTVLLAGATALLNAAELQKREPDQAMDEMLAKAEFMISNHPRIESIQIHRVKDKNNDGTIQAKDELIRIHLDRSSHYTLHVREPIPAEGELRIYVPQHHYWGTSIDVIVNDYSMPMRTRPFIRTNVVDLTKFPKADLYEGKALGVIRVPIEEYKKEYERTEGRALTNRITYRLTVMGKNGATHSCIYTVDYAQSPLAITNTITAVKTPSKNQVEQK